MKHTIAHDLSPALAKKATERAFAAYAARFTEYNPVVTWTGETHASISFKVKGVSLKGTFELVPRAVEMNLDVPFVLKLFQKRAIEVIDGEVREWLEKARTGQLD